MHRRGEQPIGQRGNKVNVLPVDKLQVVLTTPTSHAQTQLLVTTNNLQYQSAVGQLVQSHPVSQPVAQMVGGTDFVCLKSC
jgi:hypothetical protein